MEDFLKDSPFDESQKDLKNFNPDYDTNYNVDPDAGGFSFAMNQDPVTYDYNSFSPNYTSPQNNYGGNGNSNGMPANDPYFEAFDVLGSPSQQPISPTGVTGQDLSSMDPLNVDLLQFTNDPMNNLDQLVSPDNTNALNNNFATSQHFSPARGNNYSLLNSIAEDSLPNSYHNTFSPNLSRHGSISVPPLNNESYLSPQVHAFMSPQSNAYDGSFDTLKSPYSGSYLNSPPPPLSLSLSKSIPTATTFNQTTIGSTLSPPQQLYGLPNTRKMDNFASSKQLTQEEKVKRRREFHNAVERRRRDLIKEKIKELGVLVPPSLLTPQVCAVQTLLKLEHLNSKEIKELLAAVKVKETKPNKATILMSSVDYIRHLKKVSEKQDRRRAQLEREIEDLEKLLEGKESETSLAGFPSSLEFPQLSGSDFNPDDFFSDVITEPAQY